MTTNPQTPRPTILDTWQQPNGFRTVKMALGWACYRIVMLDPRPPIGTGWRGWVLQWAGYYADPPSREGM
jgi:hypothetical protein